MMKCGFQFEVNGARASFCCESHYTDKMLALAQNVLEARKPFVLQFPAAETDVDGPDPSMYPDKGPDPRMYPDDSNFGRG